MEECRAANGVIFDVARDGSIIAVEVLKASKIFSGDVRKVIETAVLKQAV